MSLERELTYPKLNRDTRGFRGVPLAEIELGYAATAHRAQGGEAAVVVVVLDARDEQSAHPPTRAHVYTSIMRGRARVIVAADAPVFAATVARAPAPRRSTLADACAAAIAAALAAPARKDAASFERFRAKARV